MSTRVSIILIAIVFFSGSSWADSWQQSGSAKVSKEYDSNPTLNPVNQIGIWRSGFNPSYMLTRTGDANVLNAGVALQVVRTSIKTLSRDRNDPSGFIYGLWQSDAGEFGLSAKYSKVSTRLVAQDNAGSFFVDGTSSSHALSGSWSKTLSERNTLSADGAYQGVSYKGGSLVNFVSQSAGSKFAHAWNDRSTSFLSMSYVKYVPADGTEPRFFANASLGWNWEFADILEGTVQMGKYKINAAALGTQGVVEVKYTGQRTGLVLNANRQITPSGLGGFVTIDQANGSWSYALNELSDTGIDLAWSTNRSFADSTNRIARAWLLFNLNSYFVTRAYYQHRTSEQGRFGTATSTMLGISLAFTHIEF